MITFEFKIFHSYALLHFIKFIIFIEICGLDLWGKKFDVQIQASVFQPKIFKNLGRGNGFS